MLSLMRQTLSLGLALSVAGCAFAGQVSSDFKVTNPLQPVTVVVQFSNPPLASLLNTIGASGAASKMKFKHFPKVRSSPCPRASWA